MKKLDIFCRQHIDRTPSPLQGHQTTPKNVKAIRDVIAHCILPKAQTTEGGDTMMELSQKIIAALKLNSEHEELHKVETCCMSNCPLFIRVF